jgi:trans-2,3-dihydro-3-hydroxyanthranilate isomerase
VAHRLTWLDVFTSTPLTGNGLAVVHGADDLDEATMLAFARETRLSETTFVQRATASGADYRNRIFWMKGEMPFAGHPSLGTAVALARERGEREARYVQQTPAGLQPIEVELVGTGDAARASMLQEPAEFGAELDAERVLAAVGLTPGDADPELPAQAVSTGIAHAIVPVRDAAVLGRVAPTLAALEAVLADTGCGVVYLAACDPGAGTAQARAFFDDPAAATEDPATGSAAGPLCAYLEQRTSTMRLTIEQGVAMGRPSRLECAIEGDRVRVGGDVVVISDGTLLV